MIKRFLFAAAMLSGWPCLAQITLPEMVLRALANNPGLAVMQAEAQSAGEEVTQARSARLPALDFSGSYRRQSTVPELHIEPIQLPFGAGAFSPFPGNALKMGTLDNFDFRLTATQPLFTGFRLSQRLAASQAALAGKTSDVARQRAELISQVEKAYAQILKAQKYIEIAASGRDQVSGHVREVKKMVDQGILKKEEILKAEVRLSEAELSVVQAENGYRMSRSVLENLLGEKLAIEAKFSDMPLEPSGAPDAEVSLRAAYANRSELKSLFYAQEASRAISRIAKGSRLPSVAAFGSLGYGKPGLDFIKKEWMDYWLVGVGMEWNVWNWGKTKSQVQQTEIKQKSLADVERQLRDAIALDVTQAHLQLQETMQRKQLCVILLAQAEESYRVIERQYQQGVATHTDYFDAQSVLTRARLGQAQAEIDFIAAQANVRRAEGLNEKPYANH